MTAAIFFSKAHWQQPFTYQIKNPIQPSKPLVRSLSTSEKVGAVVLAIFAGLLIPLIGAILAFYIFTAVLKEGKMRIGTPVPSPQTPPKLQNKAPSLQSWLAKPLDLSSSRTTIGDVTCDQNWQTPAILSLGMYDKLDGFPQPQLWRMTRHGRDIKANYLSNFYPKDITVDGRVYKSVEHYYQAAKFPLNSPIYLQIVKASSPEEARRIASQNNSQATLGGDQEMVNRMKPALWAKFVHPNGTPTQLGQQLLATGSQLIFEGNNRGNHSDMRWGAKIDCHNTSGFSISLEGKNLLGKLLMDLRDFIR